MFEFSNIPYNERDGYLFFEKKASKKDGKTSGRGKAKRKILASKAIGPKKKAKTVDADDEDEMEFEDLDDISTKVLPGAALSAGATAPKDDEDVDLRG